METLERKCAEWKWSELVFFLLTRKSLIDRSIERKWGMVFIFCETPSRNFPRVPQDGIFYVYELDQFYCLMKNV